MSATTRFTISNVNEQNKYKGSYKKIFEILDSERIFTESFETEQSIGLDGSRYFLEVGENVEQHQLDKILKLKNVTLGWN